ncbi:hypothetical protein DZ860_03930 [Vibrio sinensis]|uniref:Restriction endonuclease n=1 Tax=Vibrio sinensis TaxID=2302434 RepID=A0A3A6QN23_9VIBR|nr:hypothetical protein [Vibrio sinensis]RJX74290.1 hypothetical protein DZ860_03930 [Vibrio sinensis]
MLKNIITTINTHLSNQELDIRKTNNARFIDQKCTPDVLSSVAESILEYLDTEQKQDFTIREIWNSEFAIDVMVNKFQKPSPTDVGSRSEYDKVFSQPIKLLDYAGIISEIGTRDRGALFQLNNREVLEYISVSDDKALKFLINYLESIIEASGLKALFDGFFHAPSKDSFANLKEKYIQFIIDNTPINGETETSRIFTKIINPLAFSRKSFGTSKGRISKSVIQYSELFYNRVNFRDVQKPKDQPRKAYLIDLGEESTSETYQVEKAKRQIKKHHKQKSETHRFLHEPAIHAHHIFMKSEFRELSDTLENLILLTPSQHYSYAHLGGNTQRISKPYQLVCLLSKIDSIEESEYWEDDFYSKSKFVNVVNTGLEKELLKNNMSFQDMKNILATEYVS